MNPYLLIGAGLAIGLFFGALLWQLLIAGPEIAMADADRLAAIEDRDRAVKYAKDLGAVGQDLERERSVANHLHRELHVRSLTPTFLYERIGEPKPFDAASIVYEGSKAGDTGWWRMPRIPDDVRDATDLHIGSELVKA